MLALLSKLSIILIYVEEKPISSVKYFVFREGREILYFVKHNIYS
jgi:hypothetical protein